jgi:hypothetical protein
MGPRYQVPGYRAPGTRYPVPDERRGPDTEDRVRVPEKAAHRVCILHPYFASYMSLPEWRNWQTRQTQNLVGFAPRAGSTPASGTKALPRRSSRSVLQDDEEGLLRDAQLTAVPG